ncbi:hypothetical protein F4821DRAFT_20363 [Hypoxylon rubiginosum]|uniref:Uncharacterized protein n=1 Tax=Hypoxylon rubiginosum TaxID=110542 RepID=A0ACC0DD19_9PEZI|nr:hypothetical protein F4821DRAFT_20363 [Hypoxylon rubiginosum]
MTSRSYEERHFLAPPTETDNTTGVDTEADIIDDGRRKRRKRDANVYDAVAGRVTTTRPLSDRSGSEEPSHHYRTSRDHMRDPIVPPEDLLFRRIGAPVRFAEKDIYQAHEDLRDGGRGVLPDSDMLKAIHSYSSYFYAARDGQQHRNISEVAVRNIDERSMDETALLALGILLEETGREVLGRRGDLVFTEGVEVDRDAEPGDDAEIVGFKPPVTGKWQSRPRSRNLNRE